MSHQLWDFVRPRTEHPDSTWRVIAIDYDKKRLNAELRPGELEPPIVRRVEAPFDFFISLEEEEKD